jgi:hypothetical protein
MKKERENNTNNKKIDDINKINVSYVLSKLIKWTLSVSKVLNSDIIDIDDGDMQTTHA